MTLAARRRSSVAPPVWYFAYGSNLAPGTFVGRRGLAPLEAYPGWIDDYALRFDLPIGPGERAVANLEALPGARTWGVAYRISAADGLQLDRSEGVDRGFYERLQATVRCPDNPVALAAFTYQSHVHVAGRKPSRRYLDIILDGARHHGLPREWIAYLEGLDLAIDERL